MKEPVCITNPPALGATTRPSGVPAGPCPARPAKTGFDGASWTTDAPYRETQAAFDAASESGAVCVEMEAAALYAYAAARNRDIVCFAHVTNTMAKHGNDFEKGEDNGARTALTITQATAHV